MKCKKIEKWISDSIDGVLPAKKKEKIEDHLKECSRCRSYREYLEKIQSTTERLEYRKVHPGYWEELPQIVKERITSPEAKERKFVPFAVRWRWAAVGTVLLISVVIGLSIFYPRVTKDQEAYVFSFEDSIEHIFQEISDNEELEEIFNLVIVASIGEFLDEQEWEEDSFSYDVSSYLENLSEEELSLLNSEIKKEINS